MKWEDKKELARLGNASHKSDEDMAEFQLWVLENAESFDLQAWDMFINVVSITPEDIELSREFWDEIEPLVMAVNSDSENFGIATRLRIAMLQNCLEF